MANWTQDSLKQFEARIASLFNQGKIRAPVHLSDGNELALIDIFKDVKKTRLRLLLMEESLPMSP